MAFIVLSHPLRTGPGHWYLLSGERKVLGGVGALEGRRISPVRVGLLHPRTHYGGQGGEGEVGLWLMGPSRQCRVPHCPHTVKGEEDPPTRT